MSMRISSRSRANTSSVASVLPSPPPVVPSPPPSPPPQAAASARMDASAGRRVIPFPPRYSLATVAAMRIETLAVHAGGAPDRETGAIAPPIHLSTTFEHPPDSSELAGFLYSRYRNPTQDRLESALAALEAGAAAVVYGSGMAAAVALF